MFQSTRLRLTAWYLLIIMCISTAFSFVLYKETMFEVKRFARIQQLRVERQIQHDEIIITPNMPIPEVEIKDMVLVQIIKQRILITLGIINGAILLIAGGLGYFLAGKTLQPIQEMVEEQNRFVSDASHELKTPLTTLKTVMEVHLREKNTTLSQANTLIRENIEEVNRLQSLTEGLLQISAYEKTNGSFQQEFVSLATVVESAIKKVEVIARAKKIKIESKLEKGNMLGSAHALTDLWVILLDNAIKYSAPNTIVTVEVVKKTRHITAIIKDEGMGIDSKNLPHIFDRFYRADAARKKNGAGGYGLGLSIAKKIVEYHKGKIKVESRLGKGTEVHVQFLSSA